MNQNYSKVTRVEVIGDGREYTTWNRKIDAVQLQDNGQTLKVFLFPTKDQLDTIKDERLRRAAKEKIKEYPRLLSSLGKM